MKKLFLFAIISTSLISCGDGGGDDKVKAASKDGSVEVLMAVTHAGSNDVLKSTFTVWKGGYQVKLVTTIDTIPSLGRVQAESEEDDDGNTVQVSVPKEYEFYITVAPPMKPTKN